MAQYRIHRTKKLKVMVSLNPFIRLPWRLLSPHNRVWTCSHWFSLLKRAMPLLLYSQLVPFLSFLGLPDNHSPPIQASNVSMQIYQQMYLCCSCIIVLPFLNTNVPFELVDFNKIMNYNLLVADIFRVLYCFDAFLIPSSFCFLFSKIKDINTANWSPSQP